MKVCVGIVTRGRSELARKAVSSALMQSPQPSLIWVIEDGVMGKKFEWKKEGPVKITRWIEQKGYMEGRQLMMMNAGAAIYVSLDDDAWFLDENAIQAAVREMEKDAKIAAVGFEILTPEKPEPMKDKGLKEAKMFIGCGHALRLSAVREVGGYEKMPAFYGGEEKDLSLRLMDKGWKVVTLTGVYTWHEKTEAARNLKKQRRAATTNDLSLILRRTPLEVLPFALFGNALNQIIFSLKKPYYFFSTVQGIFDFIKHSIFIIKKRQPVSRNTWTKWRKIRN